MPDAPPTNQDTGTQQAAFAGKYADNTAAINGFNELRKQIGLEELDASKPLYGEGGHFPTRELAESIYKDSERVFHKTRQNKNAPASLGIDTSKPENEPDPQTVLEKSGLKVEEVEKAIKSGGLTDEQIKAIRAAEPTYKNKSDALIQTIAKGHFFDYQQKQLLKNKVLDEANEIVGGEQQHQALRDWAKANVPESEIKEWNKIIESSPHMYTAMIRDFDWRYRKSINAGGAATLAKGGSVNASPVPQTMQEFQDLMRRVNNGDHEAQRILMSIPQESFAKFYR